MFGIFEMDGRAVKSRRFADNAFDAPKDAVDFLANFGPVVEVEYEGDDYAVVCHGRALNVYTVEAV